MSNSSLGISISVDAMGGDNAPIVPIEGSILACKRHQVLHVVLYGDEEQIEPLLANVPDDVRTRLSIEHCPDMVTGNDKPSTMIRKGKNSSMNRAIQVVNSGDCVGMVSAGNTGALMALAMFGLRCLDGIERPALGRAIPSLKNPTTVLDLGANLQCNALHLVKYAMMGTAFAETVLQLSAPSVALLNIGTEEIKGPAAIRRADSFLMKSHMNYQGFIEGADLCTGKVDVIVCDGFSGNVALKTAEGMFNFFRENIRSAFNSSMKSKIGAVLAKNAISQTFANYDPIKLDGAPLLGLKKTVVKAHGNTSAEGFANAINMALEMSNNHIEDNIAAHLSCLQRVPELRHITDHSSHFSED